MQFQVKYPAHPVHSHEAKILSLPILAVVVVKELIFFQIQYLKILVCYKSNKHKYCLPLWQQTKHWTVN